MDFRKGFRIRSLDAGRGQLCVESVGSMVGEKPMVDEKSTVDVKSTLFSWIGECSLREYRLGIDLGGY